MNILDLDPQEFEGYFLEGYDERTPEENEFLLEAYRKRNSALSPAYDAIQASEIEGRRRLNILPATIPQGMTFFDALREGEVDFAVPGMFMGAAEATLSAVDMPSATLRGPVSEQAMGQAAMDAAGMVALGAAPTVARAASQGVDPSILRMAGMGDNGGPPMPPERVSIGLYSPSLEAAKQISQQKGSYSQLRAQILKGGGKEEELRFAGLDDMFDPDEKVTRQQLEDLLRQRSDMVQVEETRARGVTGESYSDPELYNDLVREYVESNIDSEREYYRNEYYPERASEELMSLREFYDQASREAASPPPENLTPFAINPTRVARSQLVELQNGLDRRGYLSVDDYLEDYPDAVVSPDYGGGIYDNIDEAIDSGIFGDLDENVIISLEESAYSMEPQELAEALGRADEGFDAGETTYSKYMTPGVSEYRERRYGFTDPGAVMSVSGEIRNMPSTHFDNDRFKNFVHTRTGLASVAGGRNNAYHVGEIQSDFSQGLRNQINSVPEETAIDRTLIRAASPFVGDITEQDWRKLKRMENDDLVPALRGNVVDNLTLDPERSLGLEDFKDAVVRAQGAARNELGKAFSALVVKHNNDLEIKDDPARREVQRREQDDLNRMRENPEILGELLNRYFVPDYVKDRLRNGDWLSDEEIAATAAEGNLVPAAVAARQAMALSNVDPDVYRFVTGAAREAKRATRSPQPYIGSTNRWVDFALKSELVNAAKEGKGFFTISNPEMVRRMTYGSEEGQGEFYGKIVPQRLKNIVKKLDKDVVVEMNPEKARQMRFDGKTVLGPMRMDTADGHEEVLGLTLTPKLRAEILEGKGLSSFAEGGIVTLMEN